jgi:DNA-binding NtrC family response regulator
MEAISVLDEWQPYREAHTEPGHVTEEQAAPLSRIETLEELTLALLREITMLKDIKKLEAQDNSRRLSLPEEVRRFEIEIIRNTLLSTGGHQARAARLLGLNATTLNSKLKRYHIDPYLPCKTETETDATSFDAAGGGDS